MTIVEEYLALTEKKSKYAPKTKQHGNLPTTELRGKSQTSPSAVMNWPSGPSLTGPKYCYIKVTSQPKGSNTPSAPTGL